MTIKILIGADIVPTKTNYDLFNKADLKTLVGKELIDLLHSADYTIFNLECPLTDKLSPISKNGPNLVAPTSTINGLKAINPCFFTLANNHILDQDIQGLDSTINLLKKAGISYSGVGKNLEEANKPFTTTIKGVNLGIYCCAEHEFSIATENTPGVNPYDPLVSFDTIRELKKQCDFIIVLYHGGKEHYRYPSPQLQRVFRKFAECGANLIIAQHTHCIGCMEKYQGSTLIYGQGNFHFIKYQNEYWESSLLLEILLNTNTNQVSINYLPCILTKKGIKLASSQIKQELISSFMRRSREILDTNFIKKQYKLFTANLVNNYLRICSGFLIYIILKLSNNKFLSCFYNNKDFLKIRNIIECEAHREVFLYALKNKR